MGAGLLLGHTAASVREGDLGDLLAYRRLWSDWALAVSYYLDAVRPVAPEKEAAKAWPAWEETEAAYQRILIEKIRQEGARPAAFWRTIRLEPFLRERGRPHAQSSDDPGRAHLLALGFRLLGGPAPLLILWVGALVAVPILVWTAWEFVEAGRPVAGAVYLLLVVASPFVVESLALPRSGVGFYLAGVLLLVPLAVYAALGRPTMAGLAARAAGAGALLAVCALCRSGTLFLLPGYVLALAVGVGRMGPARPRRPLAVAAIGALTLLLALPLLLSRRPQRHETWAAVWEGLGDFDRSRGHVWSDEAAAAVVAAEGAEGLTTAAGQAVLRRRVLREVREDPGWYAGILARRFAATLTLRKLWPRTATDGLWMARSTSPNEGFMDKYWTYTSTVDFLGPPSARWEVPVPLILLPTAALVALAAWPRPSSGGAGKNPAPRSSLGLLACVAVATLPLPVLVSTAGGHEPQSFAATYALGAALLAEHAWRAGRRNRSGRPDAKAA